MINNYIVNYYCYNGEADTDYTLCEEAFVYTLQSTGSRPELELLILRLNNDLDARSSHLQNMCRNTLD